MKKISNTLQYDRPVILVGPADFDFGLFEKLSENGYGIIAADGGANRLYDNNMMPDAIIGDLDSLENRGNFGPDTKIIHFKEQETTDFEKCLCRFLIKKCRKWFYFGTQSQKNHE